MAGWGYAKKRGRCHATGACLDGRCFKYKLLNDMHCDLARRTSARRTSPPSRRPALSARPGDDRDELRVDEVGPRKQRREGHIAERMWPAHLAGGRQAASHSIRWAMTAARKPRVVTGTSRPR